MATQLNAVSSTLLPPTITGPIFAKASEQSAVMSLARRVPLSVSAATAIPVPMDIPTAGWVSEGGVKPAAQEAIGVKVMTGKKVALLVPVSQEVVMTNPAGLYSQLQQDLPTAIARAFDQAAINGKDLKSGGAGPFADYLAQTPNSVALGTSAASAGGIYTDIVTGEGKVIDKNYDFTGFVADPRFQIDAKLSVDTVGRPILVGQDSSALTSGAGLGSCDGYPIAYSKGVSGKYWRAGDQTQTLTISGTPTGGTFTLSSGGNSTSLAYNAANSTIQTAIQAWGGIYSAVTVTGTGPFTITFPNATSNVQSAAAPFLANGSGLTGGTNPAATIAATGAGGVDTNLRAIGGDWSQCAYGVGMDLSVKISNEASYFDGTSWHSAFQENLVLLLVEAYYGFVVGNVNAFVAYTKGTAAF
ncbi:MAG: phage major capsid protein [Mycobacteriaceae bacterium]